MVSFIGYTAPGRIVVDVMASLGDILPLGYINISTRVREEDLEFAGSHTAAYIYVKKSTISDGGFCGEWCS